MSDQLKPGDRVRVLRTVKTRDGGLPFCLVAIDKDLPAGPRVLFNTDEIEAEV